jgi:hypothetical protein
MFGFDASCTNVGMPMPGSTIKKGRHHWRPFLSSTYLVLSNASQARVSVRTRTSVIGRTINVTHQDNTTVICTSTIKVIIISN